MLIEVVRGMCGREATIGKLYIDGVETCYTLEDVVRPDGEKVYGETAIPAGRYRIDVTFSNRFQCDMPLLLDVPNFQGIRIHPGNTAASTAGCLLVGLTQSNNSIGSSRAAYNLVYPEIWNAIQRGEEVWIEIKEA